MFYIHSVISQTLHDRKWPITVSSIETYLSILSPQNVAIKK